MAPERTESKPKDETSEKRKTHKSDFKAKTGIDNERRKKEAG